MRDAWFISTGVILLFVFTFHYFSKPRLPIRVNTTFLHLLAVELGVMLTELASVMFNKNYKSVPVELTYFFNLLFFVVYMLRAYLFFIFTTDALGHKFKSAKQMRWICAVPLIVCSLILLINPGGRVFSIEGDGYRDGALFLLIPVCSFFYTVSSCVLSIIDRKKLKKIEFTGIFLANVVLFTGTVLRTIVTHSLVTNLFCLTSLIICYLTFENPDFYMSDRGNAFNKKGLTAVLNECIDNKTYRALGFVLRNYIDERGIYGGAQMDMGISLIVDYIRKKYPEHLIFYLRNGYFVIFDPDAMNLFRIRDDLYERFNHPWNAYDTDLYLSVAFAKIGAESNIKSPDLLINTLTLAFDNIERSSLYGKVMLDLDNTKELEKQMRVKRALESAVESGMVEVFLQPIIDCISGKPVGAEALARIRDEDGRLISPTSFIPLAEKNGQINRLGEQVFEKACRFINSNAFYKTDLTFVNINLSPIQCMSSDLAERLSGIAKRYKVPSARIHLEITEQYLDDFTIMNEQIARLQELGYEFSLDDYGSGYSNLSRLKEYPFKNIKLDMSLVRNFFTERDELISHLIAMLKKSGYMVTAEGIETQDMADLMASVGCDYLQGFYFSKPLPIEEFVEKYGKETE